MTNQSPAEALRQPLFQILQRHKVANVATDTTLVDAFMDDILELVTAYAATVEREAEERILEEVAVAMLNDALQEMVIKRKESLAALQGPQDNDA